MSIRDCDSRDKFLAEPDLNLTDGGMPSEWLFDTSRSLGACSDFDCMRIQ
jgi:hypothetical protein